MARRSRVTPGPVRHLPPRRPAGWRTGVRAWCCTGRRRRHRHRLRPPPRRRRTHRVRRHAPATRHSTARRRRPCRPQLGPSPRQGSLTRPPRAEAFGCRRGEGTNPAESRPTDGRPSFLARFLRSAHGRSPPTSLCDRVAASVICLGEDGTRRARGQRRTYEGRPSPPCSTSRCVSAPARTPRRAGRRRGGRSCRALSAVCPCARAPAPSRD